MHCYSTKRSFAAECGRMSEPLLHPGPQAAAGAAGHRRPGLGRGGAELIWESVCQVGVVEVARWRSCWTVCGRLGWWRSGVLRDAGQTDIRGLDRRTMVRRGEPLSRIGRGLPRCRGGLLIAQSRVPRALPGRHRPSRRDRGARRSWSLDAGDRPAEAGELAGGGDGDDRAPLGALLEPRPGVV